MLQDNLIFKRLALFAAMSLSRAAGGFADPLYQLTGTYFIHTDASADLHETGPVSLTGQTSYAIPDISYSSSRTDYLGDTASANAQVVGDASLDVIHLFEQTHSKMALIYMSSVDIGAEALVEVHFQGTDTITPQSATLPDGTPVVLQLSEGIEGMYSSVGTCPQTARFEISSGLIGDVFADSCPDGPFKESMSANKTVIIGQPFTFSWTFGAVMDSEVNNGEQGREGTEEGITLDPPSIGLSIVPVTPGVSFLSASGATYQPSTDTIPEPSSLWLFGIGLGGVVIATGRRAWRLDPLYFQQLTSRACTFKSSAFMSPIPRCR